MIKFDIKLLTPEQKNNRKRIIEISHKLNLSHIGSCLSTVDLIDAVYHVKKRGEKFILSNGHAGIAWYVILENHKFLNSQTIEKLHIHPDRNPELGIDMSSGSLGQGLPIAVGMALANRKNDVYCTISDGECAEGSIWESLRISQENKLTNLKIIVNANGWGGYDAIPSEILFKRLQGFGCNMKKVNGHDTNELIKALKTRNTNGPLVIFALTKVSQFPFLKGQGAHYYTMKGDDYSKAIKLLKI
ncbi:MAG: 1-deoxy-D-xylulose-5-phosphate synthase N-terminal domain-containing protein [Candidatus Levyibacteriota bacterium]